MLGTGERLKTPSQEDYRLLSNLFGAAESEYMADRFRNPEIRALFPTPGSELRDPHKFVSNGALNDFTQTTAEEPGIALSHPATLHCT